MPPPDSPTSFRALPQAEAPASTGRPALGGYTTGPRQRGRVLLTLAPRGGRTRVTGADTSGPFILQRALYLDPSLPDLAAVYLTNATAGIFQGDDLSIGVRVEPAARALITSRAATRVHTMPTGEACQHSELLVSAGGMLEYLAAPVIPFRGSRFSQTLVATVHEGATLVLTDIVTPGRLAHGEAMAYDRYRQRLVVSDGCRRPLYVENWDLRPTVDQSQALGGLTSPELTIGTLVAVLPRPVESLLTAVRSSLAGGDPASASALPAGAGIVVKAISPSLQSVEDALYRAWAEVRIALFGTPSPNLRR